MRSLAVLALASAALATDSTTASSSSAALTGLPTLTGAVLPSNVPLGVASQSGEPAGSNCTALHYIYARGTAEPATPYGIGLGDPLFSAIKELIPDLSGYGVKYPADLDCNSRQMGGANAAAQVAAYASSCPSTKFVLTGQSQGGDVIHFAAARISPSLYPSIVAIVLFGDPGNRGPDSINPLGENSPVFAPELAAKLKQNCRHNDPVCTNNGTDVQQHLLYASKNATYVSASADYIRRQFESNGQAGPEPSPEGPGEQTEGNIQAIVELSNVLSGAGIKQTCNGTTTSYIHPELFPTATGGSASGGGAAAQSTTAAGESGRASASAAAGNGGMRIGGMSSLALTFLASILLVVL